MSTRNREAGHNWERECIKRLKRFYPHAISSREGSRARDNMKVDIMNEMEIEVGRIPFDFQCKNTATTLNVDNVIGEMASKEYSRNRVVLHKLTRKSKGGRFMPKGEYVYMEWETFESILDKLDRLDRIENAINKTTDGEEPKAGL